MGVNALGVVAPGAVHGTPLEENGATNPRAIMYGKALDIEDCALALLLQSLTTSRDGVQELCAGAGSDSG